MRFLRSRRTMPLRVQTRRRSSVVRSRRSRVILPRPCQHEAIAGRRVRLADRRQGVRPIGQ